MQAHWYHNSIRVREETPPYAEETLVVTLVASGLQFLVTLISNSNETLLDNLWIQLLLKKSLQYLCTFFWASFFWEDAVENPSTKRPCVSCLFFKYWNYANHKCLFCINPLPFKSGSTDLRESTLPGLQLSAVCSSFWDGDPISRTSSSSEAMTDATSSHILLQSIAHLCSRRKGRR